MSGEVEQMRVLPSLVVVLTLHSVCFASGPYRLRVLVKEGDTIGGLTLTDLLPPSINNSGTVVFGAKYSQCRSSFCGTIFMDSSVLVKPGDTIDGFTLADMPRSPVISDNGTVAFLGLYAGCGDSALASSLHPPRSSRLRTTRSTGSRCGKSTASL